MRASSQVLFALTQDVQHCDHTLAFNCQRDVESPFSDFSCVIKKNLAGCCWMPCQNLDRVPRFQPHVDQHTRLIPVGNKPACVDLFFFIVGVTLRGRSVAVVWKVRSGLCLQRVFTPCGPTVYNEITPLGLKGPNPQSGVVWYCGRLVQHPSPSFKIRSRLAGTVQVKGLVSLQLLWNTFPLY